MMCNNIIMLTNILVTFSNATDLCIFGNPVVVSNLEKKPNSISFICQLVTQGIINVFTRRKSGFHRGVNLLNYTPL